MFKMFFSTGLESSTQEALLSKKDKERTSGCGNNFLGKGWVWQLGKINFLQQIHKIHIMNELKSENWKNTHTINRQRVILGADNKGVLLVITSLRPHTGDRGSIKFLRPKTEPTFKLHRNYFPARKTKRRLWAGESHFLFPTTKYNLFALIFFFLSIFYLISFSSSISNFLFPDQQIQFIRPT